jgi:immune inhibitor A
LNHRDELLARGVDAPGKAIFRNHIDNQGLAKSGVSGNLNILAILVGFSDQAPLVAEEYFDTLIYVDRTGTVRNYYKDNSYNTVTITTITLPSNLGWRTMPQTYSYYANNQNGIGSYPHNSQKLVEDAVDAVDASINFSQYDNDSDGFVDGLIVVHAGPGAEFTGSNSDIWSHKWSITPRYKDGVYIYDYSMQPEYWSSPGDMTCGVFCHELGHVFGLPDLYDTDYSSDGIGKWSLMAGGSWNGSLGNSPAHFDIWCKIQLGFVSPTVITNDQSGVSIPTIETNATAYKLWTYGNPGNEYFLIENRRQTGYDTYLPGQGLLIWHIDESKSDNDSEWWPGSGYSSHYKVALVQADNIWQMELNANQGNAGDPYPGSLTNRTFNGGSSPNSNSYAGNPTEVAITNISNSQSVMTADMAVGSPQFIDEDSFIIPDKAELFNNYPNPFNAVTSISFQLLSDADISVDIYDINGRLINNLAEANFAAGYHKIDWNGRDRFGRELSTGVYFHRITVDNQSVSRKMLYLK